MDLSSSPPGAGDLLFEDFSRELRRVDSYDCLIELVRRDVLARVGLTNAWLYVLEQEEDEQFLLVACAGAKAPLIRDLLPVAPREGDVMLQQMLREQRPIVIPDAQLGPYPEVTRRLGNRTVVNLPMSVVDHPLGIIGCGTFDAEGVVEISEAALHYLVQLSNIVSVALARLVLIKRDQERSELQRRLAQRHRLESLGLLAGGVAHDFNNLLTVIRMSAEELGNEPLSAAQRADLQLIRDSERSASKLTQKLLLLGRKQPLMAESLDINEIVFAFNRLLGRLLPANVEIDFIAGVSLPRVQLDGSQLEQVLMNLALNARDAMPNGGRLLIETEQVVVNGDYRRAHPWAKPGRYVLLTVTDTGVGMSAEVKDRLFEPFFTTKAPGEGTGLGLAVVWGIVQQHGGMVHCYSELGHGTAFKLYFPAAEQSAARVGSKIPKPIPRGVERILIADDQPHVLFVMKRALEGAGYRVTSVSDGAAALAAAHGDDFDLYLLDAIMPGLSGRAVCEQIRAQKAGARFLFASGYGAETLPAAFLEDLGIRLIPKPLDPETLLRTVREVLDAPPAATRPPPRD
ncbi:MAG TPA: ATP-binding protein [Polyangiaceae bacterium]|nr:ATP-binding protein [Polyangiaceae bacterium]